jgi:hypothetical protein
VAGKIEDGTVNGSVHPTYNPYFLAWASFSSVNWGEKHCIRIPVAFRLYLVKIIQILTQNSVFLSHQISQQCFSAGL